MSINNYKREKTPKYEGKQATKAKKRCQTLVNLTNKETHFGRRQIFYI